jgi:transcriptional regulator with XRE-family HTH domain
MTSTIFVDQSEKSAYTVIMSPEQCRAARGWLGWSQQELAEKARVGISTIRDFEAGRRQPIANNLDAMRRVLQAAGIAFETDDGGEPTGIGFRKPVGASDQ